jgi:predicted MFS family arabinose efflux permease
MNMSMDALVDADPYEATARPTQWGGVFATTLCVFALIASEFVPVSLPAPMAADLRVSGNVS